MPSVEEWRRLQVTATVTTTAAARLRARLDAGRALLTPMVRAVWSARAELLTGFCLVGGWVLMTDAIARLTAPIAWRFSFALFLLSLVGWRLLWALVSRGLYVLTRPRDE